MKSGYKLIHWLNERYVNNAGFIYQFMIPFLFKLCRFYLHFVGFFT